MLIIQESIAVPRFVGQSTGQRSPAPVFVVIVVILLKLTFRRCSGASAVHTLENKNVALQNQYYKTNDYLELSARRNFGLGKAGETELLVPKSVALSYAPEVSAATAAVTAQASGHTTNLQAWVNFFLHRPQVQ